MLFRVMTRAQLPEGEHVANLEQTSSNRKYLVGNYLLKLQFLYNFLCARYYPTEIYGTPRPFPKPLPQSGRSIIILKHYTCILLPGGCGMHMCLRQPTAANPCVHVLDDRMIMAQSLTENRGMP